MTTPIDITPRTDAEARWQARFRAPRVSLPDWAFDAPHRNLYASDVSGVIEQYAWDRDDRHAPAGHRPAQRHALRHADPDGETIWWFADTDGDEFGVWMTQPFAGGEDTVRRPRGRPGLLRRGWRSATSWSRSAAPPTTAASCGWRPGRRPRLVYRLRPGASVDALTHDDDLLVISHSEHGDPRYPALRVLRTAAPPRTAPAVVAEKWDGEGRGLHASAFAPLPGDPRLLVGHERRGREELLIWDVAADTETEIVLDLPGDVTAGWYPDGSALLVGHDHAARSELYRYDLATGALEKLDTPTGVVRGATARPDGTVELAGRTPRCRRILRRADGPVVLSPPRRAGAAVRPGRGPLGARPRRGRPRAGRRARRARGRTPTVFLVHGGPDSPTTTSTAPAGRPTSTPGTRWCT